MERELREIIEKEQVTTLYQPIVSLITGEIMGYEALSRGPEWSQLYTPIALIDAAETYGLTEEIEYLFRKKAIENANQIPSREKLFININPSIMNDEVLKEGVTEHIADASGFNKQRIVFELTERTMITDYNAFKEILAHYKKQNYRIAIDDVGAGYSGLRTIRETEPNYIKIDMELIRHIDRDPIKEALINAFLNFSISTDIKLIAEGIETEGELLKLIEMGVHYGQGYFLQRPSQETSKIRPEVVQCILNHNSILHDHHIFNDSKDMIGTISKQGCAIQTLITCNEVKGVIEGAKCDGLCVIEKNIPKGVIMRNNLLSLLSSQYGLSLYGRKQVAYVMDTDFLMVDYHTSISEVSTKAMARERDKIYDIIVVTKNGEFYGTISINILLQNLISVETQIAKELNPLTMLPGNIIINRVLNDIILYEPHCGVIYIDFDHFKPFNDYYGFENGDQMIKGFAQLLLDVVKNELSYGSFVGHIGGDDFICILETSQEHIETIIQEIMDRFDVFKRTLYSKEDCDKGYIYAKDRYGEIRKFGLITLSVSGTYNNLARFDTVAELSRFMSTLKKEAKNKDGHSVVIK